MTRFPCSYTFDYYIYRGDDKIPVIVGGQYDEPNLFTVCSVDADGIDILSRIDSLTLANLEQRGGELYSEFIAQLSETRAEREREEREMR